MDGGGCSDWKRAMIHQRPDSNPKALRWEEVEKISIPVMSEASEWGEGQ